MRKKLVDQLEAYYRSCGWKVRREQDGSVRADGPGGVTWIGLAVVSEDLASATFTETLLELSDLRMPSGGERCPLELLPAEACADDLRRLLDELGLSERVSI